MKRKRKIVFDRFTFFDRGPREVILEVTGGVPTLRLKGLSKRYAIDPAACYGRAVKAEVDAAKKAKRRGRKGGPR